MDTNKMSEMREAFERTNSRDHRRQPPKGNNYIDPMAQADWESFQKGWQASREAVVVQLPERAPNDDPYCGEPWDCGHNVALDECREALEAAGIRVAP